MIHFINYALAFAGLFLCTYLAISSRHNTCDRLTMTMLSLWVALWVALLFAAYPNGFEPVPLTTTARAVALVINVLNFWHIIKHRRKHK